MASPCKRLLAMRETSFRGVARRLLLLDRNHRHGFGASVQGELAAVRARRDRLGRHFVRGASKVLTLSTLDAVSVSPPADLALTPFIFNSTSTASLGSTLVISTHNLPSLPLRPRHQPVAG